MAEPRPSRLVPVLLVVAVLVGAGVGVGLLYYHNHPASAAVIPTVQIGDNVTVNYIGILASGPEVGKTFDTSIYSVALNNVSYPKSLEFSMRAPANYTPLPVFVGPSAPSGGYVVDGLTFSSVVTGFWQGLLGLSVNHTRVITFPASQGYGPSNPACQVVRPMTVQVPVVEPVPVSNFTARYPGVNATAGTTFFDPFYGWTDLVLSTNATSIVIENLPTLGWSIRGFSWPVVVTAINSTTITVTNELTLADAGHVMGSTSAQVCASPQYIVSNVNPQAGTFTEDYNHEVVGQSLTFIVTVTQFY